MLKRSLWSYETSSAVGASIGPLSVSGGQIFLKDPQGEVHAFKYHGFGPGLGGGRRVPESIRLPDLRLSKGRTGSASGSTTDFPGKGLVYRFNQAELTPRDFEGFTLYADTSAGLLIAEGITGLVVGISERALVPWIMSPGLFSHAVSNTAKGLVVLQGQSEGLIDGVSAGLMVGHVSYVGRC
jgi:hypothetical protein